jgi:hypothetical protein
MLVAFVGVNRPRSGEVLYRRMKYPGASVFTNDILAETFESAA